MIDNNNIKEFQGVIGDKSVSFSVFFNSVVDDANIIINRKAPFSELSVRMLCDGVHEKIELDELHDRIIWCIQIEEERIERIKDVIKTGEIKHQQKLTEQWNLENTPHFKLNNFMRKLLGAKTLDEEINEINSELIHRQNTIIKDKEQLKKHQQELINLNIFKMNLDYIVKNN